MQCVLLVEDNESHVYLIRRALEMAGVDCDIRVVEDGASALQILQSGWHGVVVLDLNLPRISGIEVLEAMQKVGKPKQVSIIVMTSSPSPEDHSNATRLGAERYLIKGPDLQGFLQIGKVVHEVLVSQGVAHQSATSTC